MTKINKNLMISVVFIILLLLVTSEGLTEDLYVQSIKAPIFSSPSIGSQVVVEAQRGEVLKDPVKEGNWFKVNYKATTGWVSRLLVAYKPPSGKVSILEETEEKLEKGSRRRASAFATAAAARGLAEERARISDKLKVDYNGLEWMETILISDEEATMFIRKGVGK